MDPVSHALKLEYTRSLRNGRPWNPYGITTKSEGYKVKAPLEREDPISHELKLEYTRALREGRPFPAERRYYAKGYPVKDPLERPDPRSHELKLEYERKLREDRRKAMNPNK
jgi:hypothetical protein